MHLCTVKVHLNNIFIQQGSIKLIKIGSKDIPNVK